MKKRISFYTLCIGTFLYILTSCNRSEASLSSSKKMDRGYLYVESPRKTFETVHKGQTASCFFELKNIGKKPITISKIDVSCGCIITKLDKKTIMPNMANKLTVSINSQNLNGFINKIIYVNSDAENPLLLLRVKGFVSD